MIVLSRRLHLCHLILAAAAPFWCAIPARAQFGPPSNFPAGTTPAAIAAADFNGDGLADVAVANQDANTVTILFGNAGGGVISSSSGPIAVGFSPYFLAAGDFNGDGHMDLAVIGLNFSNSTFAPAVDVAVWLGDGEGRFTPAPFQPFTIPGYVHPLFAMSVADFNADGKLDIAVTTNSSSTVLLGNGAGGFTPYALTVPDGGAAYGIQAGDFTGDGMADFALLNQYTVIVWASDGMGGFVPAATSPAQFCAPCFTATGDFNGDGKLDLVIGYTVSTEVMLGDGHGSFTPAPGSPFTTDWISGLSVADVNGDGYADIVLSYSNTNNVGVLLSDGTGRMAPMAGGPFATGTQPEGITVADFNNDGKPDIATANFGTQNVSLLRNTLPAVTANPAQLQFYAAVGAVAPPAIDETVAAQTGPAATYTVTSDQTWLTSNPATGSTAAPSTVTITADPTGLAAGTHRGTLRVNAPGYFGSATSAAFVVSPPAGGLVPSAGSPFTTADFSAVTTADFNRDGLLDVVAVREFDSTIAVLLGDGQGGLTPAPGVLPYPGTQPIAVVAGDFNHDGRPDLAIANSIQPGAVTVLLGDGTGGFFAAQGSPFQAGNTPVCMAIGDFNHDGNPDLAIGTYNPSSGSLTVLLGDGAGGFAPAPGSPFAGGSAPQQVVVADFNGDGRADLATVDAGGTVNILLGNGIGGFNGAGTPATGDNRSILASDINGDGKTDLLIALSATPPAALGQIDILLGNGDGSFTPAPSVPMSGSFGFFIGAADFDGDGKPDIAMFVYGLGKIVVFIGDGQGGFKANPSAPNLGPAAAIADFNNDGRADIILAAYSQFDSPGGIDVLLGSLAPTTVTLTTSTPMPVEPGQSVNLNAAVTVSGFATPTGAVTFTEGSTVLGTGNVSAGQATLTTTLAPGTHNLTASYGGDIRTMASPLSAPLEIDVCSYSFNPAAVYLDANSQSFNVGVTANSAGCVWTASAAGFVQVTSGSGMGDGAIGLIVSTNTTGSDRSTAVTVGAQTFLVIQRANAAIFADVTPSAYYFDFTNIMALEGITSGCSTNPPDYCPNDSVTREQMAVFIVTAIEGASFTYTTTPYFTDVPPADPYFRFIQKLRDLGITSGCSATQFCPGDTVTRAEVAALLMRARYETTPFTYPPTPYFTDVSPSSAYFPFVQKMAQTGITSGCGSGLFCPDMPLPRGQMSVFVVTGLLNQLLPAGTPIVAAAAPNTSTAGQTVTVTLTGINTHFAQGDTQIVLPPGITASNVAVSTGTSLTVQFALDAAFVPGPVSIVAITGAEEAVLPNGFTVQ